MHVFKYNVIVALIISSLLLISCNTTRPVQTADLTIYVSHPVDIHPVDAHISIKNQNNTNESYEATLTNGNYFIFRYISFGTYTLKITHDDFKDYHEEVLVNSTAIAHTAELTPKQKVEIAEMRISLITPEGLSAIGAVVSLTNHNEDPENVYTLNAKDNTID